VLAFCHIRKTAGTTLTAILRRSFGTRHFDTRGLRETGFVTPEELQRVRNVYWNLASIAGHGVSPAGGLHERFRSIRYYTFLREPISRTISQFSFLVRCGVIDCDGSQDPRWIARTFLKKARNAQSRHLAGRESAEEAIETIRRHVGFVGLVERFDESLLLLKQWSQAPELDISYVPQNVSARDSARHQNLLRELMQKDGEIAELVRVANQEDLRLYEWASSEVYPAQCRKYGPSLGADVERFRAANRQMRFWMSDSLAGKAYRGLIFKPWASLSRLRRAG
jgi:hypothetical protein